VNVAGALPFEESIAGQKIRSFSAMGLDKSACVNRLQKLLDDARDLSDARIWAAV